MSKDKSQQTPAPASSRPEIAAFIERVRALGPAATAGKRGRLIFALDATMSRQPTWDTACALQADMFREAASIVEAQEAQDIPPTPKSSRTAGPPGLAAFSGPGTSAGTGSLLAAPSRYRAGSATNFAWQEAAQK